jgi:hypothetical protein
MAVAWVANRASGFQANTAAVTSASFTPVVGNTLVCGLTYDAGAANYVTALTSAKSNVWTRRTSQIVTVASSGLATLDVWTAPVTTGGTGETMGLNYNQTSGTSIVWNIQEFSGVDLANPVDQVSTANISAANANTLTTTVTAAATSQADEVAIGLFGHNSAATKTWTAGSGFSNLSNSGGTTGNPWWGAMESRVLTATGAQTAAATLSAVVGSGLYLWGLLVTLKGATAATTSPTAFFQFL